MLKVYVGEKPGSLGKPDAWFDINLNKTCLLSDFSKKVILDIDKSEVFDKNVVISPIFGGMDITKLSTGVKNLILAKYHPELVINWRYMGRNCLPDLFKIANEVDIEVSAGCYYDPYSYGYSGSILIVNNGKIVDNGNDFFDAYFDLEE